MISQNFARITQYFLCEMYIAGKFFLSVILNSFFDSGQIKEKYLGTTAKRKKERSLK